MTTESTQLPHKVAPSVGSDALDAEHNIQLGLLDAAASSLKNDADDAVSLLEQLYSYTEAHFMSEELMMRFSAQRNYQGHKLAHEVLLQDLGRMCSLVESGRVMEALKLISRHENKLLDHIRGWDRSIQEHPA